MQLDTQALASGLGVQDDQALLVGYSGLFLTPPYAAHLDLGNGVDGQQMGPYAQAMLQTLANLGLQLPEQRHEHPDYLPVMLEVAVHLEDQQVPDERRLAHLQHIAMGLQALRLALGARARDTAWYHLVRLTHVLMQQRLTLLGGNGSAAPAPSPADQRREQREALTSRVQHAHQDQVVPEAAATRAKQAGIPAQAMLEMIANLEARGLDASHLRGQQPAAGWTSLVPPQVKRGHASQPKAPTHPNAGAHNK